LVKKKPPTLWIVTAAVAIVGLALVTSTSSVMLTVSIPPSPPGVGTMLAVVPIGTTKNGTYTGTDVPSASSATQSPSDWHAQPIA